MEKIEIVLRREQNNRNGIYLNYINGYWYTYEWSAFLLCMLHPEVEVRKCIGVQPDENYAIARVNKKIIKKLERKYQTSMMDDSIKRYSLHNFFIAAIHHPSAHKVIGLYSKLSYV